MNYIAFQGTHWMNINPFLISYIFYDIKVSLHFLNGTEFIVNLSSWTFATKEY